MPIIVARGAGFCMGVSQAVDKALEALEQAKEAGIPAYTLGELIHNPQVVDRLASQGLTAVQHPEEAKGGLLVLRSHGVSPQLEQRARESAAQVVDCTCPFVRRLHQAVSEYSQDGKPVIMVGDPGHPEVEGTAGHCKGPVFIVSSPSEVDILPIVASEALLVSQTTFPPSLWQQIKDRLLARFPAVQVKQTICAATTLRQEEAAKLAATVDSMVIVGGRNSANTRKLYETCKAICPDSYLVESAAELPKHLRNRSQQRIGVTAGASTPEWALKEVIDSMNDMERMDQTTTPENQDNNLQEEVVQAQTAAEDAAAQAQEVSPQPEPEVAPEAEVAAPAEATAGAEAPAQEEQPHSEPEEQPAEKPASFMDEVAANMTRIRAGQTVTGVVVQITDDEVCVNIGYKSDGLIKRSELVDEGVQLGDDIEVEIVKVNDGEGNVILSQRNIVNRKVWDDLMQKYEAGEYIEAVGKEAVKGGLIASIEGVRAFIPASHLSQRYVEKISQFVGQPMRLKIIEVDSSKKRVVASRKEVIMAEAAAKKEAIWDNLQEGEVIKGIVRRFASFGAFVDIGGVDGLIHITDLSWNRSAQPQDILKTNQEIDVKVLSLDRERERIQLGYKQLQPRPWDNIEDKYPVGEVLTRKVVRIRPFGAFVELEPGVDGLVHISQVALQRINKVEDVLQPGQEVNVKVLAVDPDAKRISLSIREALEEGVSTFTAVIPGEDFSVAYQDGVTQLAPLPEYEPYYVDPVQEEAPAEAPVAEEVSEPEAPVEEPVAEEAPAEEAPAEEAEQGILEEVAEMAEKKDINLLEE